MEYDVAIIAKMNSNLQYVNIRASGVCIIQKHSFRNYIIFIILEYISPLLS
jgi:hypothetical protein